MGTHCSCDNAESITKKWSYCSVFEGLGQTLRSCPDSCLLEPSYSGQVVVDLNRRPVRAMADVSCDLTSVLAGVNPLFLKKSGSVGPNTC